MINDILQVIGQASLQLWERPYGSNKNWKPCASAVLVKDSVSHYLLTCAHSFEKDEEDKDVSFGFVCENTFYPLNEERYSAPDTDGCGICDISVLKLSSETISDLLDIGHLFISKEHLGISLTVGENSILWVCGYPANRTKMMYGKDGKQMRMPLPSGSAEPGATFASVIGSKIEYLKLPYLNDGKLYKKNNVTKEGHFLLDYHAKKIINLYGNKTALPRPWGISGGGLWAITPNDNYYLMGIMVSCNIGRAIMQATRIDYITELMRFIFKAPIPQSNIIQPQWYKDNST